MMPGYLLGTDYRCLTPEQEAAGRAIDDAMAAQLAARQPTPVGKVCPQCLEWYPRPSGLSAVQWRDRVYCEKSCASHAAWQARRARTA